MPTDRVVFVSDVHIHFGDAPYRDTFLRFLDTVPKLAERLVIHGDLFDFYVGGKQGALEFYSPLFAALRRVVACGVRVGILKGNRDFLLDDLFTKAGVELLPDGVVVALGDRRAHVSHGDAFCIHDTSYQRAKRVLRSALVSGLVRRLPVSWAIFAARRYRKVSAKKARRLRAANRSRLSTVFDGVRELLDRESYDFVICGHIHHLAETPVAGRAGPSRLVTTGAWEEGPNYLWFDGSEVRLCSFESPPPDPAVGGG